MADVAFFWLTATTTVVITPALSSFGKEGVGDGGGGGRSDGMRLVAMHFDLGFWILKE